MCSWAGGKLPAYSCTLAPEGAPQLLPKKPGQQPGNTLHAGTRPSSHQRTGLSVVCQLPPSGGRGCGREGQRGFCDASDVGLVAQALVASFACEKSSGPRRICALEDGILHLKSKQTGIEEVNQN